MKMKYDSFYMAFPTEEPRLVKNFTTIEYNRAELVIGINRNESTILKFRHGETDTQD